MTEPTRWADAGDGATPLERTLVRAGQDLHMPTLEKSALWERLVSVIPPPATPTPAMNGPVATQASSWATPTLLKAVGVVVVALAGFGVVARSMGLDPSKRGQAVGTDTSRSSAASVATFNQAPSPSAELGSTGVAVEEPMPAERVTPSAVESTREASARSGSQRAEASSTPVAVASAAASPLSQLREESKAVLAVRHALRSNDVRGALLLLEKAQSRFGSGALNEEREALMIEALVRSGDRSRASQRAKAFLRAYPRSPHRADVERQLQ